MSHDFSFSTKSVILIVAGCIAIGVLLFVAGYIIGLDKGQDVIFAGQHQSAPKARAEKDSSESSAAAKLAPQSNAEEEKPSSEKSRETQSASEPSQDTKPSKGPEAKGEAKAEGKDKDKDKEKPEFSLQLGAFQT